RLFSLSFRCPSRRVSAQRRSVVAHYREFFGPDNSFFAFFFRSFFFSTNSAKMFILNSIIDDI
ncbi:hypothetical protein J8V57_10295, partial [Xenorhabdus sp. PB61.4]|uniref:hypothetical protein n=1 Tax=Xenorhabdus sp. PB61.4 TaxID=2788940 RepID=UPI001E4E5F93